MRPACYFPFLAGEVGPGLALPALDMAMATAWGLGLPAWISVRMLEEIVALDLPDLRGMDILLESTSEPCADGPTDEATGDEGDEDFEFVHERFSF